MTQNPNRWAKLRPAKTFCPVCKKPQSLVPIDADRSLTAAVYRHDSTGGLLCD